MSRVSYLIESSKRRSGCFGASPAPTGLGTQYEQLVRKEPQPSWALILPAPRVMGAETVEERSVPIKVV